MLRRRFYVLALLFGALYVLIQPPRASIHELQHLLRAYELSWGTLGTRTDDEGPYHEVPHGFARLLESSKTIESESKERIELEALGAELSSHEDMQQPTRLRALSELRSPLAYAAQVPAVWIARLLNFSAIGYLYLARLFSLVVCVLLIGRAMRWIEELEWLWLALALSPAVLMQAAACSPDGFSTSLAFLFFALIARCSLLQSEPGLLARQHMAALPLFALLVACRPTFLAFGLSFFALRREANDEGKARHRFLVGALLLGAAVCAASFYLNRRELAFLLEKQVLPQLQWMLAHPGHVAWAWLRTAFTQIDDYALETFVGTGVVPSQLRFVGGIVFVLQAQMVVLLSLGRLHTPSGQLAQRRSAARYFGLVALVYIVAIFLSAHVASNQHARGPLQGLTGSLFLPVVPALLLALTAVGRPIATHWLVRNHGYRVLGTLSLANLICVWALVGRYYGAIEPPWPY